jgi:CRP-like cAMP-binding protein
VAKFPTVIGDDALPLQFRPQPAHGAGFVPPPAPLDRFDVLLHGLYPARIQEAGGAAMGLRWPFSKRGISFAPGVSGRPDKVWYMRQTRLFDRLSEPDLRRLEQLSEMQEYPRGEVIPGPEPRPDVIYLVKAGRVKVSAYSPDGKEQVLALLDRGDLFGDLVPAESPVPTRVEALDRAVVCTLQRTAFEDIIRSTPDVALKVIRILARRLRAAEQEIEDLALRDVPGRLAALLLRLAEAHGVLHDRGIRLLFRLTHQDLAQVIGSTRETVTMIMNRFQDDGLIAVEQRTLILLDRERLRAVAQKRRT